MVERPSLVSSGAQAPFRPAWLTSPDHFPIHFDTNREIVSFVKMSRETYTTSVFLDLRTQHLGSSREVRLDDLCLAAARDRTSSQAAVVYILHPAFCCSTLLARYFEILPPCLVLKEPLVLTQVAHQYAGRRDRWREYFDVTTLLLSRRYDETQTVIIKAHEPCNILGDNLLSSNPRAKVVFIRTPLVHFLVSVLKSQERRRWLRARLADALSAGVCIEELEHMSPHLLSDEVLIACMWTINHRLCERLRRGHYRDRVLAIDSEQLIDCPGETLAAVLRFCGLPLDHDQVNSLVAHPTASRYSKSGSRTFDADSRRCEIRHLTNQFAQEISVVTDWSSKYAISNYGPDSGST
jgi:hypothetical protein